MPAELQNEIAAWIERAAHEQVVRRLWDRDESLWGGPAPEIGDRLGWLTVSQRMLAQLDELNEWAMAVRSEGLDRIVLLGMGGSSLGPEVLRRSFGHPDFPVPLHVLDSTDPDAVRAIEAEIDLERALFVVSSKSGGTVETLSHLKYFWKLMNEDGSRFVAVTDPGSPLQSLAEERGFRRVWKNDPDIGGRYSVMSFFGLVPAALAGLPVRLLLQNCQIAERVCNVDSDPAANAGLTLGLSIGALALGGRDKLTFVISPPLTSFGLWAEQLIAESTGKSGRGILPVVDEPLAGPDAYGNDRVFLHLRSDAAHDEAIARLETAGHPVLRLDFEGPEDLGGLFFLFEFATAVAGWVLEINPFDQPNVQEAKAATAQVLALLESESAAGNRTSEPTVDLTGEPTVQTIGNAGDLAELAGALAPNGYVAMLGYLSPSAEFDRAVMQLRVVLRERSGLATTFGYGPRYLHSTGQLHKGGAAVGGFVQLLHDPDADLDIPGSKYTFAQLKNAQAAGDLQALKAHGRPVVRVVLNGDPAASLAAIADRLQSQTA